MELPVCFTFSSDICNMRKVRLVFVYHHLILYFQCMPFQSGWKHKEKKVIKYRFCKIHKMLYPGHTPGKNAGFIWSYAFCQHIYCSVTQFRQKRSKRKETWDHLPRFALPPLCYQLSPLIALSLSVTGSRCWATQWHLNSLTCVLVPCSLTPSTCCQNRAACLGVQFCHLSPWHETLSMAKWDL